MKDGYYWARIKRPFVGAWCIYEVYTVGGKQSVYTMGVERTDVIEDYEFGDKIEVPSKYNKGI